MSDDYHGDWVMSSIIEDRAERLRDRTAVHTRTGALSWAYLRDRAQRAAAFLASLGVKPGDRVATMLDPTPDYLMAWFACSWMGAVEVPVNTDYKGTFLELVLRESQASVLILQRRYVERIHDVAASELLHLVVVGDGEDEVPTGKQLHEAHHQHEDQCHPDPDLDVVGRGAHEGLDFQVLRQHREEVLCRPPVVLYHCLHDRGIQ